MTKDKEQHFNGEAAVPQSQGSMVELQETDKWKELAGRVCRLHSAQISGSGFLVAPDLVITALHVVENLKSTQEKLFATFPWSEHHERLDIDLGDVAQIKCEIESPDLDYAVLRLPRKVGYSKHTWAPNGIRGWFDISKELRRDRYPKALRVFHFPIPDDGSAGDPKLTCSPGSISKIGEKIWSHDAGTRNGSSGGICLLGESLYPSAMHLGTRGATNSAVPLWRLVDHILNVNTDLHEEISNSPTHKFCPPITKTGNPILNRELLIKKLVGMLLGGDLRPLLIAGEPETGRTFISDVVAALQSRGDFLKYVHLASSLSDYEQLVSELHFNLFDTRCAKFEPIESVDAYFRRWVTKIARILDEIGQRNNCPVVLFADGLDSNTQPVNDLISLFCELAPTAFGVRIIFAGSALINRENADLRDLSPISDEHHHEFVESLFQYNQTHLPEAEFSLLKDFLREGDVLRQSIAVQCSMISEFVSALGKEVQPLGDAK